MQNILNIQPVIPFSINREWNIITRTIIPVISMPAFTPTDERTDRDRQLATATAGAVHVSEVGGATPAASGVAHPSIVK